MYKQSPVLVNPRRATHPQNIVLMSCGERVVAPHISADESFTWVRDMVEVGWTALRDGNAILLHPVAAHEQRHMRWAA